MDKINKQKSEPGMTGLSNLGSTCYFNSVMQCYSNTKMIHNFFIYHKYTIGNSFNKFENLKEFRLLITRLWSGKYKSISPAQFKAEFTKFAPQFKGRDQQDAHEFIITMNSWLHENLNCFIKQSLKFATPEQIDWVENNLPLQRTSIIRETFEGLHLNIVSCAFCNNKKQMLEAFENLSLALPSGQASCTLEECLNVYYSQNRLEDYTCEKCHINGYMFSKMKILGHPQVLVICLKRFIAKFVDGSYTYVKNTIPVNYPFVLNLSNITYTLYAVVAHKSKGLSLNGGHYLSIVKNVRSKKWARYDDKDVDIVDSQAAIVPEHAYILFYQKEN